MIHPDILHEFNAYITLWSGVTFSLEQSLTSGKNHRSKTSWQPPEQLFFFSRISEFLLERRQFMPDSACICCHWLLKKASCLIQTGGDTHVHTKKHTLKQNTHNTTFNLVERIEHFFFYCKHCPDLYSTDVCWRAQTIYFKLST